MRSPEARFTCPGTSQHNTSSALHCQARRSECPLARLSLPELVRPGVGAKTSMIDVAEVNCRVGAEECRLERNFDRREWRADNRRTCCFRRQDRRIVVAELGQPAKKGERRRARRDALEAVVALANYSHVSYCAGLGGASTSILGGKEAHAEPTHDQGRRPSAGRR